MIVNFHFRFITIILNITDTMDLKPKREGCVVGWREGETYEHRHDDDKRTAIPVRSILVTVTVVDVGAGRFSKSAKGRTIMFIQIGPSRQRHY